MAGTGKDNYATYKDGEYDPPVVAPPTQYVIDAADPDSVETQALLMQYEGIINQFVNVQRRNYALSSSPQHKATLPFPDIDIVYLNQFGHERVTLTPRPTYPTPAARLPGVPPFPLQIPNEPLCLMVLYQGKNGDNGIAVFDMTQLPALLPPIVPPAVAGYSATYWNQMGWPQPGTPLNNIGQSQGSDWGGQHIRVHQENFSSETILTPINFTPKGSPATSLVLWPTDFSNGLVTQTEAVQVPVMNGDDHGTIYTALDVYDTSDQDPSNWSRVSGGGVGAGTATLTNAEESPTTFTFPAGMPYFIDNEGNYYCNPAWYVGGFYLNAGLGWSYPQQPESGTDNSMPSWADDNYYPTFAAPPNNYPSSSFKNFYTQSDLLTNAEPADEGAAPTQQIWEPPNIFIEEVWSGNDCTATVYVVGQNSILEGVYQKQTVPGFSIGSGSVALSTPGGDVSFPSFGDAGVGGWYVDPTNVQETWVQEESAASTFGGQIPYPQYQVPQQNSSGKDVLSSVQRAVNVTGSATLIYPGDGGDGGTASYAANNSFAGPQAAEAQWIADIGSGDSPDTTVLMGSQTPVDTAGDAATTAGVSDDLYTELVDESFTPSSPASRGAYAVNASYVPWTYANAQITVGIFGIPVLGIGSGEQGNVSATSGVASGSSSSYSALAAAENALMPQLLTITGGNPSLTNEPSSSSAELALPDFNFDYTSESPNSMTLLLEPFPPSVSEDQGNGQLYFSVEEDDSDANFVSLTITTPFGTYMGQSQTSFYPWLHVSNGQHWAQGFYVDDTPYLFLDGQDLLAPLTQALQCEPSDIRAIFMDVPYSVAGAIANVTVTPPAS